MLPFMAIFGAGAKVMGGLMQAQEIRDAARRRMEQMQLQGVQDRGAYTAAVGATGVEGSSSTVQTMLAQLERTKSQEITRMMGAAQGSANNAIAAAGASAWAGLASDLNESAKKMKPAEKPEGVRSDFTAFDEFTLDEGAKRLNQTLSWSWDR